MRKPAQTTNPKLLETIRSYYKANLIDLTPVPDTKFRHFRLRLPNGSFYKVRRKIRDSEDLREALLENSPLDVYYSTACWLNPHQIAGKLDRDILKNVMLSCDLAFDIDVNRDVKTLEDARLNAVKLNDFLDSKGFRVRYNAFSGSKGFHVVCDDPWRDETVEEDPRKRESCAIFRRRAIVQEAKSEGVIFDEKVTVDSRRIIRVPGTINSKTGHLCSVLGRGLLDSDLETIFKSLGVHRSTTPRISQRLREMTGPSAYKISGFLGRLGVRPRPKPDICYSTFFSNNIPGTRLKVPVLEFGGWSSLEKVVSQVKGAQERYGLGDVALLGDKTRYWAISLKAVPRRRVEKILQAAESLNLNQCRKYGCTYTRVGKSVGVDGRTVQDEPSLVMVLESDLRGQASRTHYEFLSSIGVHLRGEGLEFCGAGMDRLELVHAIIE